MSESPGDPRHDVAVQAEAAQDEPDQESGQAVSGTPDEGDRAEPTPELPKSLTFHITRVTLLVVIVLAVCMTPVAWAQPWMLSIYAIPVLLFVWILRTRTVVTTDLIAVRMLRTTRVPWDEVQSFRLDQRRWLRAVLRDDATAGRGREVLLPAVRVRDLPTLAAMSGGRLPDFAEAPAAAEDKDADPPADEGESGD